MILTKILSSYTFRAALATVLGISIVVLMVMLFLYTLFSYNYFNDVHEGLSSELNELSMAYEHGGVVAANHFIDQRRQQFHVVQFAYVIADLNLNKISGNLNDWPEYREYGDGWLNFEMGVLQGENFSPEQDFVAVTQKMFDGNHLLVARSDVEVLAYVSFVIGILVRGFIVTVVLGTVAAFIVTWEFQRRLDNINRSIKTIMAGDLSTRLKISKLPRDEGSELQQLAINLNTMLNRIQDLMDGVKQVSDNIAHDLRTPLTRLRNDLVSFQQQCSADQFSKVESLILEADEMLATFNSLLRIARIELGETRTEKISLALDKLITDVVDLYEPLASEKEIDLQLQIFPVECVADRNLLFQACANIVDNAIKYTPAGGHVHVVLSQGDKYGIARQESGSFAQSATVTLSVIDSGCGIDQSNYKKVLQRFYREESSRSQQPGNGLGLSLVAAVAKLHDFQLVFQSNNPGLQVHLYMASSP